MLRRSKYVIAGPYVTEEARKNPGRAGDRGLAEAVG